MWIEHPGESPWAGDEKSYEKACKQVEKINATQPQAFFFDAGSEGVPSLLDRHENVGVIRIAGTLHTQVPDWAKVLFGAVDYPMIRDALVQAATDTTIGAILLDVNSPGGNVNGVGDVADLIAEIDSKVKPVLAYTSGTMASAAYWLSSGARSIQANNLAEVGSIGVLMRHSEVSKLEEKMGITTTILRSGKYKALGNPFEPLSDLAKQDIQSKIDYTYGIFLGHVAKNRGVSIDLADAKMGQGRTFIGEQALSAGLVDKIGRFEDALTSAQKLASEFVDKRKSLIQNPKKQQEGLGMKKKATLTEQQIAALASGAPLEGAAAEDPKPAEGSPAELSAETPEQNTEAEAAETPTEEQEAPESLAEGTKVAEDATVVALLKSQLREKDEDLFKARVDLKAAESKVSSMEATYKAALEIAKDSTKKMYVALGKGGEHVDALSAEALLAEHAQVSEVFKKTFKVGGVAAAAVNSEEGKPVVKTDSLQKARLNATRIGK